ncbi:aminotransferase class IV [Haloferula sargassicola]|uniref:branched-chain-amino-acid transaminase n=1 Tax=Haloferula sargassicola TaxID=490096 RepID=A0ABP9UPC7_9BACT
MKTWILEGDPTPLDRGHSHGLGVFETLLALDGRLVRPDWHFERMEHGCRVLEIDPPDREAILAALAPELGRGRQRVRIVRTAGAGSLNQLHGEGARTLLSLAPCPEPPDRLSFILAPWPKNEASPLAAVKCLSYAENLLALDAARQAGADEAVFLNTRGELCEGATSNLFLQVKGRLLTPPLSSGCLPGTFRRGLLESGQADEAVLVPADLASAEAVYLTSATRGKVSAEWRSQSTG